MNLCYLFELYFVFDITYMYSLFYFEFIYMCFVCGISYMIYDYEKIVIYFCNVKWKSIKWESIKWKSIKWKSIWIHE